MKKLFLALFALSTALTLGLSGCAGMKGPSDEELARQTCDAWAAALIAKDVEKFKATISDDFTSGQAEDKEALCGFIQEAIDSGYLDEAEVVFENAAFTMADGKCTVYPVDLSSAAGSVAAELTLSKADGKWLVTGMEVDGL